MHAAADPADRTTIRLVAGLAGFVVVALTAGVVGAALQGPTAEIQARYEAFTLPAWAPPPAAFGIVWPVLYVLIGVAAWQLWRTSIGVRSALTLWGAQLVVNAAWPWVFFGVGELGWAVAVIAVLVVLVVATMRAFARHDRPAAWLLAPYLAWILYATALNTAVWQLN